jgi:hypothetical protein
MDDDKAGDALAVALHDYFPDLAETLRRFHVDHGTPD